MVEEFVIEWLRGVSAITSITSGIYCEHLPESHEWVADKAALILTTVSQDHVTVMGGRNSAGLVTARIQFDALSEKPSACNAVIEQLRQVMHGKSGTINGTVLRNAFIDPQGPQANSDPPKDGSAIWISRRTVDYFFSLEESIPSG